MGGVRLKGWTLDADGTGKRRKPGGNADGWEESIQPDSDGCEQGQGGETLKCPSYSFVTIQSRRLGVEYMVTNHSNEVWGLSADFKENWTEYAKKFNPA